MRLLVALAVLAVSAVGAKADAVCHPNDAGSRVLASANPNDLAPNWRGESFIGTGWTFAPASKITSASTGLDFLKGRLISPRGGDQGVVFVLAREWDCQQTMGL